MPTPITTDQVKRLSEFDTLNLSDELLMPVTNALGTVGGKTTIAQLRAKITENSVLYGDAINDITTILS